MPERTTQDKDVIESIIRKARFCRIGLCDDGQPYVVPVCFGYQGNTLYFHCAKEGRKIDILRKNNAVCFEIAVDCELTGAEQACQWGVKYRSVIGFGKAAFVEDTEGKRKALDIIMKQYSDGAYEYPEATLERARIVRIEIESATAKVVGY